MLKSLYDWTMEKLARPSGEKWLAGLAFSESIFFPIPIDILMIPMILANRLKAWRLATITLIASVIGGIGGYLLGAFLYESIAAPIIELYGYQDQFTKVQGWFDDYGIAIVLVAGFTPIPFKVVTIASGFASLNPLIFILTSIPARGARFYLVAGLLWKFGDPIKEFIEKRLTLVVTLVTLAGLAGFAVLKLI
ncbi:YqaA family protein [Kordiimonas sp. SCSIO 12610]|uniref:YqaA family protein n=1 Tax=Kordiimonas sp. SCSIO 12610 TaxID=2829597 RepID=UPI002109C1B4|nr:YqaA family protein [Kordiimonas sp. SCSIO 12610]UTW55129.1 DedA family protein [Kordiimonas sp. SCSIO 12610]